MKIFKLPDLGEGLQEAEIVKWHVKAGDEVRLDQPLLSVETAKAIVDIPAPYPGRIARLYGNVHDVAHVGAPLVDEASTTSTPSAKPAITSLRAGNMPGLGSLAIGKMLRIAPRSSSSIRRASSALA